MREENSINCDLASAALLELTPSLREKIKLLIPQGSTRDQAATFIREKAWSELCLAARQAGKLPVDYSAQILERYCEEMAIGHRPAAFVDLLD